MMPPAARSPTAPEPRIPRSAGRFGSTSQPSATEIAATRTFGARGQSTARATPRSAPPQAIASIASPREPPRRRQNGVYVPAMSTKIAEWSSRRIASRARGDQVGRW